MAGSLVFDSLELCGGGDVESGEGYWFDLLAEGASFGEPQPAEVVVGSLLRDGALVEAQGDGNREQSWLVRVRSTDGVGLAAGVAALHLATGKRTTLTWTPPDDYSDVSTVFDVETSSLHEASGFDDLALLRNEQVFRLRVVCLPYGRSAEPVVDDADSPPSSGGTSLYGCESTTGWSRWAPVSGTGLIGTDIAVDSTIYSQGSGSLRMQASDGSVRGSYAGRGTYKNSDKVTGLSLSTGTGGYLAISLRWVHDPATPWAVSGLKRLWVTTDEDGEQEVPVFAAVSRTPNGFVRHVWPVEASKTVTGFRFEVIQHSDDPWSATPYVWYDDVRLLAAASTDYQIVKHHFVQGSARTTGSLRVSAPNDGVALGRVLVITAPTAQLPAGFLPDARRWVTQGTPTTDTSAPGGSYYTPDTDYSAASGMPIFDVPAGMLTAGPYTMVALVEPEEDGSVYSGVQAQLRIGATNVGPTSEAEVTAGNLSAGWQLVPVGTVYLPPLPVQSADADTRVRLLFKGAPLANVFMVPAWQVGGRPVADFSIVDCGTGTVSASGASSSLWIDSPSTSQPQGGWWRGPSTSRLNARSAWPDAKKPGIHTLNPGPLTAFVVSTAAVGPTSTLEYHPRWYGSAAS